MLSLFTNPFAMIAGILLISSPIIIHLINRMRYRRIRWAAMEFLLKSQKRARRKLIIEQLILLLLRILMVLLAGLLLARFVGCDKGGNEGRNTLHLIIIDDTMSNGDQIRGDDGQTREVFEEAKRLVADKITKSAAQAGSPQFLTVVRLSELDQPRDFGRVNASVVEDVRSYLIPYKASLFHVNLVDGLKFAKTRFESERNMRAVLHVVSDFRANDWSQQNAGPLQESFEQLKAAGVEIHLLDCVTPERGPQAKSPRGNDNLAVVDLTPESKIVPKGRETEFTVKVRNYSNSVKKGIYLRVRVNGEVREEGSVTIGEVPPNGEAIGKFYISLRRGAEDETDEAGTPDRFNLVSATLEGEVGGLAADNTRFTVVEVRDRVPLLLVDNNTGARGKRESESYFLYKLFNDTPSLRGFDVQVRPVGDLESLNLQTFAAIFICDVPRFSPNAQRNLEEYVRAGGGLGFFMGPSIKSDVIGEYNEKLYRKGEGIFPVPLDKLVGLDIPEEKRIAERIRRSLTFNKKLLVRRDKQAHPALEKLYTDNRGQRVKNEDEYERFFNFVVIDRYVSVNQQLLRSSLGGVETLVYLQNNNPIGSYEAETIKLTDQISLEAPAAQPYTDRLKTFRENIRRIASSTAELYQLSEVLTRMLDDTGDEEKKIPGLKQYWGLAENNLLREQFEKLRDKVQYGDPLYVARSFGKGRVTAFMSSAGASWNDLEGFGRAYYPPLMINMLGYLSSSGTDVNPTLRSGYEFQVDKGVYDSKVIGWQAIEDVKGNKSPYKTIGNFVMASDDTAGVYRFPFPGGKDPGLYAFKFQERRAEGGKADGPLKPDFRALVYNVDALHEGDLARANSDDVSAIAQKAPLHTSSDDSLDEAIVRKSRDFSENPLIYLIILLVLIAEQAMAVRLSFHTRGGADTPATGPTFGTAAA